jgi:adenylate cyclase
LDIPAVNIYRNVIPPAWLKDKIVLIGSTATGAYDHYPTPYIHTYPGVEIHATVIENILSHTYCKKFNRSYLLLISIAVGIILGIVFCFTNDQFDFYFCYRILFIDIFYICKILYNHRFYSCCFKYSFDRS